MSLLELCQKYFGTKDLYNLLNVSKNSSDEEVKKAYRRLSLKVHPDRVPEEEKELATEKFKVLGKVHSILSDKEKRACYDDTGCIDEDDTADLKVRDWSEYWRLLFKIITVEDIEAYEKTYKDSKEEAEDLVKAYMGGKGSMDYILNYVPFSNPDEEPRLRNILQKQIDNGEIPEFPAFIDESPRKKEARRRKFEQEKKLANKAMRNGKRSCRGRSDSSDGSDSLVAMIKRRNQERGGKQADDFFKALEEKYANPKKNRSKK